jgi:hypothetical protein
MGIRVDSFGICILLFMQSAGDGWEFLVLLFM